MKAVTGRRDDPGKPGLFVLSLWTINALHAADPDPAISLIPVPGDVANLAGAFKHARGADPIDKPLLEPARMTVHLGIVVAKSTTANSMTNQSRPLRSELPDAPPSGIDPGWRDNLKTGLVLLATVVGFLLLWHLSSSLLVIFAGVLFASFFDACARALKPVLPVGRGWRLALVIVMLCALLALGAAWSGGRIPEQTRYLVRIIDTQLDVLQTYLLNFGIELFGPEGGRDFSRWFPDHGQLFGHAQMAIGTASSVLANTAIMLFLGMLFSFSPGMYRESIVLLVRPSYRARMREVLNEMGTVLQLWLVGQIARIALMTVCVWAALYWIGLPGALLLGLQAGLSNFIPYLGPIVAGIPIALVAMPLGFSMLLWSVGIYTVVQSIEGYIIGPLILRQAVEIPPAWILVAIVLLGSLFGAMGIALAVPLVAIGRVAVLRFYVEDCLGDTALADRRANEGNTKPVATSTGRT